ncbi:MAG: hypothetical protein DRQ55_04920 [Planctomycetota bacterium]|nr:MAG: hypothetical protein DRQ55_04920 [Planctomycetota bacterium]
MRLLALALSLSALLALNVAAQDAPEPTPEPDPAPVPTPMPTPMPSAPATGPATGPATVPNPSPMPAAPPTSRHDTPIDTGQRVVASVNGEPITGADISFQSWLRAGVPSYRLDDASLDILRRQLAEQVLMATEADLLGVTITESYIANFWGNYQGGPPDYEQLAAQAGVTDARARALVKRSVMADLYLYHRVGIWSEFGHLIKPEPMFSHLVEVTPKELRDLFKNEREVFDLPDTVTYEFYPCPDEPTARGVIEALSVGLTPGAVQPGHETAPMDMVPEVFAFSAELVTFLQEAEVGAISPAYEAEAGWVVFELMERTEGRPAEFSEVQEELRRRMRMSRLDVARTQLLRQLTRQAVFWPKDLFDDDPLPPPKVSGRGAASTLKQDN